MREGELGSSANVTIPGAVVQPGLEMVVEIDPYGTIDPALGIPRRFPSVGRKTVEVQRVPPLNLTLVPFVLAGSNDSSIVSRVDELHPEHNVFWETNHLIPVDSFNMTKHRSVLVDSYDPFSLFDDVGRIRTLEGGTGHWLGLADPNYAASFWAVGATPGKTSFSLATPGSRIHNCARTWS